MGRVEDELCFKKGCPSRVALETGRPRSASDLTTCSVSAFCESAAAKHKAREAAGAPPRAYHV